VLTLNRARTAHEYPYAPYDLVVVDSTDADVRYTRAARRVAVYLYARNVV
jgi:hypothetical protein